MAGRQFFSCSDYQPPGWPSNRRPCLKIFQLCQQASSVQSISGLHSLLSQETGEVREEEEQEGGEGGEEKLEVKEEELELKEEEEEAACEDSGLFTMQHLQFLDAEDLTSTPAVSTVEPAAPAAPTTETTWKTSRLAVELIETSTEAWLAATLEDDGAGQGVGLDNSDLILDPQQDSRPGPGAAGQILQEALITSCRC